MGSKVDRRNPGWYSFSLAGELLNLLSGSKWHPRVPFYTGMLTVKGRQAQREPGNPTPAPPGTAGQLCSGPPREKHSAGPSLQLDFCHAERQHLLYRRHQGLALPDAPRGALPKRVPWPASGGP